MPSHARNLALVYAAMGISFVAQSITLLVVPLYASTLGAPPAAIGLLVSAAFLMPTVFAIPMGRLVTRFGVRRMMTAGAAGMALAPVAALAAPGFAGLLAMQLLIGTTQLAMGIAAQATVAEAARGPALERAFGWYTTAASVGQMAGPLVGGVLLDVATPSAAFATAAALPLASLACALSLRVPPGRRLAAGSPFGYRAQAELLRGNPAVQVALVLTVAVLLAFGTHAAFFPVYLEGLAVPASVIGALLSLRALASTLVRPLMAWAIVIAGGRARAMVACVAALALGVGATGLAGGVLPLGLLAVLIGIAAGLGQPLSLVVLSEHVPTEERPSALGLRLTFNQGTQLAGPIALGAVAQAAGYAAMFVVGGLLLVVVLALLLRRLPAYGRQLEGSAATA
jgi:MFS family permease